ncbi:MAG: hypothetical protein D3903_04235 [Candidatus Electrothrix sp. GM3_4]|nr:hypothetical protein [Candidatus Electrothrix sp. GM3_4]
MDINPLIADLNKYRDELALSISIAFDLHELEKSDVYIANDIAEIKGESVSSDPFQQVGDLYNLPRKEVPLVPKLQLGNIILKGLEALLFLFTTHD